MSQYVDPKYFKSYEDEIHLVKETVRKSKYPNLPVWLGEGAVAFHEGTPNVSDRYISGFLWEVSYVNEQDLKLNTDLVFTLTSEL